MASIFGTVVNLVTVASGYPDGPGIGQAIGGLFWLWVWAAFGLVAGLVWSSLVTALTLPVVYLCVWSLHLRQSIVLLGAFSGGLIGFIAALPICLLALRTGDEIWVIALLLIFGPGMTTVIGQIGGAWGGTKSREIGPTTNWQKYLLTEAVNKQLVPVEAAGDPLEPLTSVSPRWQFRIRHLLWVSVWLSLLLTLIRLCRIPYELILPLLLVWVMYQSATLWLGGRIVRWLLPWWIHRRQARST